MNDINKIVLESEGTMGYVEAENKESFITGAQVAAHMAKKHYQSVIEDLEKNLKDTKALMQMSEKIFTF